MDWNKESKMFNQMSDYYDKFRPSYPLDVVEKIIQETGINQTSQLLEIGAGSGKATELFAAQDLNICCIEPGPDLVERGTKKFANNRRVGFITARFEEYDLPQQQYDVIYSTQAFHWIPQPIGYEKCAFALKDKGYLALMWNMYITYENKLDQELLEISNRYGGFTDFLSSDGCEKRIASICSAIENSRLFHSPHVYRFPWSQEYTADEYFGFVLTSNSFVQRSDEEKQRAYQDITVLANKHGRVINRPYICALYLAQKI
ncbi:MAG: class I SAM-dependent methyltransferase [Bacillota bacterium]